MKKTLSFCLATLGAGIVLQSPLLACGPSFPASYYSLTSDMGEYARYEQIQIRPDLIGEMKLIGAHYYPEWCNRKIYSNNIKSADANRLDFLAAAAEKGLGKAATDEAWEKFEKFNAACEQQGASIHRDYSYYYDKVEEIPDGIEDFKEFYLYSFGLLQVNLDANNTFPDAWKSLLELPAKDRHYRTAWVKYMQVILAKKFTDIDAALNDFRKTLDAGFADTLALEEAVIRKLVRRSPETGLRYYPLAAVALAGNDAYQKLLKEDFLIWAKPDWLEKHPALFFALMADNVGREIATVLKPELVANYTLPSSEDTAILTADRQAWRLFESGQIDKARELLKLAPDDSLIRLFMAARFARMDGDYELSANYLRRFLELYKEHGKLPDGFTSEDVTLVQYVNGMLGVVRVQRGDFEEALYGFIAGNSWFDAKIVAENYLTANELKRFVDSHSDIEMIDQLKNLLARRLMREYRPKEAGQYFVDDEIQAIYQRYMTLSERANDQAISQDERALAMFHLASLLERNGNVLFGAGELQDRYNTNQNYNTFFLPNNWGRDSDSCYNEFLWRNIQQKLQPPHHERFRAAAFAQRAAQLAEDPDLKIASLWMGMVVTRRQNPLCSEGFYRSICDQLPHPAAKRAIEAKWLPKKVLKRYLDVFGDSWRELTLEDVKTMVEDLSNPSPLPQKTEEAEQK